MQGKLAQLEKKYGVDWREFRIEDVLEWQQNISEIDPMKLDEYSVSDEKKYPFYGQAIINNGIIEYRNLRDEFLNNKNGKPTILIHSNNQNIVYLDTPFYLKDGHGATSVLQADFLNKKIALYLMAAIKKVIIEKFSYNNKATKIGLKNTEIELPTKNGEIAYEFMNEFVETLEAYLKATGLNHVALSAEERSGLDKLGAGSISWKVFNLEALFGKATRGRRLKSADRVAGNLPFVTAGEADMGISAFIGNDVQVFSENTVTIDMFGSAKYRNYKYGADDHVAVVHTEKLDKFSALFTTSAIHKSAHAGQFDYSRNFYATDADELMISLPVSADGKIDFDFMSNLMSAMQKVVIKGVVEWADKRIEVTKGIIER